MNTLAMLDHSALSHLVKTNAVDAASVIGQEGGWAILVRSGVKNMALIAQRSGAIRIFKRFETLVAYLQGIGIMHFEVDTKNYHVDGNKGMRRPDRAESLKKANEAAAYEKWFREKVKESEEDPRESISDEEARRRFLSLKNALQSSV